MPRKGQFKDISGVRFGRVVALKFSYREGSNTYWSFKCDCGTIKDILVSDVKRGCVNSCGCIRREMARQKGIKRKGIALTHGFCAIKHQRFYNIFNNIKARCNNPLEPAYPRYGGRGIECMWRSFENFRDDMYESYIYHASEHGESNTSIDRVNNNSHYSRENCRWATLKVQARNTRSNRNITLAGETKCLMEWTEIYKVKYRTVLNRINRGWDPEKALTTPPIKSSV